MELDFKMAGYCHLSNQMDAVNQTLLLSLRQEVKNLNEVVNKLPTAKHGEVVRSWLFPSKPYYFVHELVYSEKICESESFKTYLEIIIDRLYVGICLILNYVEEKIRKPEENRFIYRPKLTTLGYNFERLWEAVSVILSEEMSTHMVKETTTGEDNWTTKVFNKETQTNIISLNKCDSCASAMLCMKNLLQSFNKNQFKMPLNERQLLRPKIYDITQFGCMLQTTSSIEKGLNRLYEKLLSKEQERDLLYSENQQLKTQISEKRGRITFLQRETEMLKDKLEKDSLKITILNTQIEELSQIKNKQDCHIKILTENVSNLNKSMKAYNEAMSKLISEKAKLSFLYKGIMNSQLHVITFSTLLETRLTAIEDKHADINNSFKLLDEMVDIVNKRLNKMNNVLTAVDIKINKINYLEGISLLESKLQQLKQIRHGQEETTNVCINLQRNSFQIKGNPVEDLTRQMEENNVSIKKLENENIKLKCIISKLTSLKK